MDKQRLIALLQKTEGTKLDFKLQLSLKTDSEKKELAKDVTAIANSKGGRGYIIFGVEDKTQRIAGIDENNYREEQLQQIISQRCDPPVTINYDVLRVDDKSVGVLTIYKSSQKPHQIRQTGSFYVRRGSTTDIARREEIASMFQESGLLQYERIVVNSADIKELDSKLIDEYIFKMGVNPDTNDYQNLLDSLGIIARDEDSVRYHPTVGGLLIFGYNPQKFMPNTGIKLINNFSNETNKHFVGPIIKMLDDVEEYFKATITNPAYPVDALIEAIANAAVHRDYFAMGREIVVTIARNKIEISNPGSLCGEDEEVIFYEDNNPCRRNPWLYQRLMILDNKKRFLKSGIGMNKIRLAFKQIGEARFINNSKRNLFKVILPGLQEP